MRKTGIFVTVFVSLAGVLTAAPAGAADVSPFCREQGYCLFAESAFNGLAVVVPLKFGCHAVAEIGPSTVQSAARGFGDSYVLDLHSNGTCSAYIETVTHETPRTSAKSYELMQIPTKTQYVG